MQARMDGHANISSHHSPSSPLPREAPKKGNLPSVETLIVRRDVIKIALAAVFISVQSLKTLKMRRILFAIVAVLIPLVTAHPRHHDCSKIFNPQNYMDQLPALSMPYLHNMAIPSMPMIKPSPVATTRVINVVTKYVSKSPVCIKVSGKKPPCKPKKGVLKNPLEYIVTKEYYVKDRQIKEHKTLNNTDLQGSETPRSLDSSKSTPKLESVRELLIEDRLDRLEDILPHYTRMRVYQTSTITITKTRTSNKAMATLMVKNCIPEGLDYCKSKIKKRKSKLAPPFSNNDLTTVRNNNFYYG